MRESVLLDNRLKMLQKPDSHRVKNVFFLKQFVCVVIVLAFVLSCSTQQDVLTKEDVHVTDESVLRDEGKALHVFFHNDKGLTLTLPEEPGTYLSLELLSKNPLPTVTPIIIESDVRYHGKAFSLPVGLKKVYIPFASFTNSEGKKLRLTNAATFTFSLSSPRSEFSIFMDKDEYTFHLREDETDAVPCAILDIRMTERKMANVFHGGRIKTLFPQGTFQEKNDDTGAPVGWNEWGRPETILVSDRKGATVERYLLITNDDPEKTIAFTNDIPLDTSWERLRVSARMRTTKFQCGNPAWEKCARIALEFLDENGNPIVYQQGRRKYTTILSIMEYHKEWPWSEYAKEVDIHKNAHYARLITELNQATGTALFDDIAIAPVFIPYEDAVLPKDVSLHWGEEPVVTESKTRAHVVLNGLWRMLPAFGPNAHEPGKGWGYMWVPGSVKTNKWRGQDLVPTVAYQGKGVAWNSINEETRFWYERKIHIPSSWNKDENGIFLFFRRVSTDAVIYINGKKIGGLRWPGGEIDITDYVTPGESAHLLVFVFGVLTDTVSLNFMGVDAGSVARADIDYTGITGDVIMRYKPRNACVHHVTIQPSFRKKEISLVTEFTNIVHEETVDVSIRMENMEGVAEVTFTTNITLTPDADTRYMMTFPWEAERIWDVKMPELYMMKMRVEGETIHDEYTERFGFRELWIDGKFIFLNGKELRFRPIDIKQYGDITAIESIIDGLFTVGYNAIEMWPRDLSVRGKIDTLHLWYDIADEKGMTILGNMTSMARFIVDTKDLTKVSWTQAQQEEYRRLVGETVREHGNHPSIVMWVTTANFFAHHDDQNPRYMGKTNWVPSWVREEIGGAKDARTIMWEKRAKAGNEGIAIIKSVDPTRNVMTHSGTYIGDIHGINCYLNMQPLQEREEWLREYRTNGHIPVMIVEMGCPVSAGTFNRSRGSMQHAFGTEAVATEHGAAYFGHEVYHNEEPDYREAMMRRFRRVTGKYDGRWDSWQDHPLLVEHKAVEEIAALFVRNTYRSWRLNGITGGILPWEHGLGFHAVYDIPEDIHQLPKIRHMFTTNSDPFTPGRLGFYNTKMPIPVRFYFREDVKHAYHITTPGHVLMTNNSDVNAWIAGKQGGFEEKEHNFFVGDTVEKQVVIMNDSRFVTSYTATWDVALDGKPLATFTTNGRIGVCKNIRIPFTVTLPAITGLKKEGCITLRATIGDVERNDTFSFRTFKRPPKATATITLFDPVGETTRMLDALGYTVREYQGGDVEGVLVIGRTSYPQGKELETRMGKTIETFVEEGGRLLIFEQDPTWLAKYTGARTSQYTSRRIFHTDPKSAFAKRFDHTDLSDWRGKSTLLDAYRTHYRASDNYPMWGWRWGAQGGITSAAIEKPHMAAWRSILECEYDLAYSPLMELNFGKGKVVFASLDLEERYAVEPVANYLARYAVEHTATAEVIPRAEKVVYIGGTNDMALLTALGARYTHEDVIPLDADLIIVGADAEYDEGLLTRYTTRGGKVFFLRREGDEPFHGVTLQYEEKSHGPQSVPPLPIAEGLGVSAFHGRATHPAWVIKNGATIAADGFLAYKHVGNGEMYFSQFDPRIYEGVYYLRLTKWRATRALTVMLGNLGVTFKEDARFLRPFFGYDKKKISLATTWKYKITQLLDGVKSPGALQDPGMTEEANALIGRDVDDSGWNEVNVPGTLSEFISADGEAVARLHVTVPKEMAGKELILAIGAVDDFDETFWNGVSVGKTDKDVPQFWSFWRRYTIPKELAREGENVIAVRFFDWFGGGGFGKEPSFYFLVTREFSEALENVNLYHPDYINYTEDFISSDNPFRYRRW